MTTLISLFLLLAPLGACGQGNSTPLSLGEALRIANENNLSLAIAREEAKGAKAEERQLNALWFPSVSLLGEYTHSLSEIAAVTTIGKIGSGVFDELFSQVGDMPVIGGLVEDIAQSQVRLPLVPRNTAEIGAEMVWVAFSGGRRVAATRIAKHLDALAQEQLAATQNGVTAEIVGAYFGVAMALHKVEVCRSSVALLGEHLRQAKELEAEGMINRAERLAAEVAYKQSVTLFTSAEGDVGVAQKALATLLGTDSLIIHPTTPLSLPASLPIRDELVAELDTSPAISALRNVGGINQQRLSMERSRYLPSVALFGHQQLWSTGLDKNLFPRTVVGVGLSWTLFDGLAREGAITQAKSTLRNVQLTQDKTLLELQTAVDKHFNILSTLLREHSAQQTTIALAEELVRMRQRAFAEGMATSSEVVDAVQMLAEANLAILATLYNINISLSALLMVAGKASCITDYLLH